VSRVEKYGSRGQVLLITAFAMMALIAIAALVIDLGLSWMLRREEQNAADPGAIAAARYIQDGDSLTTRANMDRAACFYARLNGFFASDDAACTAAFDADELQVLWPPSGPFAGDFAGRPEMVLVVISSEHESFFGKFFGQDHATVATGAVAARETQSANSNSLVALDPDSCASGFVNGNGVVTIAPVTNPDTGTPYSGGYVHVNSSCDNGQYNDACSNGSGGFKKAGNAGSKIIAPHIYIHGTCESAGGTVQSPVTEGAPQIGDPLASLIGPRQEDYPAGYCPRKQGSVIVYDQMVPTAAGCNISISNATVTLTPGVYYGGWTFSGNNMTVKLLPGIYIIAGGGIKATGSSAISSIGADPTTDPARVLLFSTDNTTDTSCSAALGRCVQGQISLAGQNSLKIWGLDSGPYRGLLMWQDGRGSDPTAPISIVGQGAMNIAGTIYAPKANVKLEGNGSSTAVAAVQIISWTWEIGGNGNLYMPYDPAQLYTILQRGLVL
jgi:hypothetical protein